MTEIRMSRCFSVGLKNCPFSNTNFVREMREVEIYLYKNAIVLMWRLIFCHVSFSHEYRTLNTKCRTRTLFASSFSNDNVVCAFKILKINDADILRTAVYLNEFFRVIFYRRIVFSIHNSQKITLFPISFNFPCRLRTFQSFHFPSFYLSKLSGFDAFILSSSLDT